MGSDAGVTHEQLVAVAIPGALEDGLFDDRTQAALEYADAITSGDVDDALYAKVQGQFTSDEIVELTGWIAWENSSARFNRALRIPSQHLWNRP